MIKHIVSDNNEFNPFYIYLKEVTPYNVHFELYVPYGIGEDDIPSFGETHCITTNMLDTEPELHGYLKWDGCGNWGFPSNLMVHTCTHVDVVSIGYMMQIAYEIAKQKLIKLGIWDEDCYSEKPLPFKWAATEYQLPDNKHD